MLRKVRLLFAVAVLAGCTSATPREVSDAPAAADADASSDGGRECSWRSGEPCTASGPASLGACPCGAGYPESDRRFVCCYGGRTAVGMCVDGVYWGTACEYTVADSGMLDSSAEVASD